jgi:hypothetical protein
VAKRKIIPSLIMLYASLGIGSKKCDLEPDTWSSILGNTVAIFTAVRRPIQIPVVNKLWLAKNSVLSIAILRNY